MDGHRTCAEPDCERRAVHVGPYCGEHMRTRRYHEWRALTVEDRFWARVDRHGPSGCWLWFGGTVPNGYGTVVVGKRRSKAAHRYAYELLVGAVPDGMVLDHTCHNADETCMEGDDCQHRRCVNPAHLEPVTQKENMWRGRSPGSALRWQTECHRGHDLTDPSNWKADKNHPTWRICKKCQSIHRRDRYLRLGK